jgi:hypothetical protein
MEKQPEKRILNLGIADPIADNFPAETVISINQGIPDFNGGNALEDAGEYYQDQAEQLVDALTHSLPSGTRLRVIKLMLTYEIQERGFFRGL